MIALQLLGEPPGEVVVFGVQPMSTVSGGREKLTEPWPTR